MRSWCTALMVAAAACAPLPQSSNVVPAPRVAAHQHLISPEFAKVINQPVLDGAGLLRLMDDAHIERGVVLSMGYSFADERKKIPDPDEHTAQENDWTSLQVVNSNWSTARLLRSQSTARRGDR